MRTMNYLLTIALLFVAGSCSKDTPADNEDLAAVEYVSRIDQQKRQVNQEVFAIDLHQYHVLGQLEKMQQKKQRLEEEIEDGDTKKIPILEELMKQIKGNTSALASNLELSCAYLKFREKQLIKESMLGNEKAKKALKEVREKLKGCGLSLSGYFDGVMETRILSIVGGDIGGNCDPGVDFDKCSVTLDSGILLINYINGQSGGQEVYFKSKDGKIIDKQNRMEDHSELEGVQQIAIELKSLEKGILEFKDSNGSFERTVRVQ